MQISEFDFDLPQALIAQQPVEPRSASRLLGVGRDALTETSFAQVIDRLRPDDLLVVNNTRVVNARMYGHKTSGGAAEIMLERVQDEFTALCQVRVSKPLREGSVIVLNDEEIECVGRLDQFYILRFPQPVLAFLESHGHVPLPPYIERDRESAQKTLDRERYQTVFNETPGAVAAPTAGLHFDDALLAEITRQGTSIASITLHVGAGTFQPVRGNIDDHVMHSESIELSATTARQINATKARGGRIVAVGTTVMRTLESVALKASEMKGQAADVSTHESQRGTLLTGSDVVMPWQGETNLFIQQGFNFRVVDALITNFHLPRSTLLMLVCAFAGYDRVMAAYEYAVEKQMRFFSYGDAMWLEKTE